MNPTRDSTTVGTYLEGSEVIAMPTVSSREFNRDVSAAKRAAADGPVVITDRGEPAYVLLSLDEFRRLKDKRSLVQRLSTDEDIDVEFERFPGVTLVDPWRANG